MHRDEWISSLIEKKARGERLTDMQEELVESYQIYLGAMTRMGGSRELPLRPTDPPSFSPSQKNQLRSQKPQKWVPYRGIEADRSSFERPYTLSDISDSVLSSYSDIMPWEEHESALSYKQRIVNSLNAARLKALSYIASHTHSVSKQDLHDTNFDPNWGDSKFGTVRKDGVHLQFQYGTLKYGGPREFVTLDIETDDKNKPVTISALKQVFNIKTGTFETVDRYQRFYTARDRDMLDTVSIHGLTAQKLKKLRSQQARINTPSGIPVLGYGRKYNAQEAESLKAFFGDSILVGHNIVDFDLQQLFPGNPLGNQTIDTMTAARNMWPGQKNDLDSVFQRLFGMTMEQAGLPHHMSSSDVIATAMIASVLLKMKGATPDAIRYVATHGGTHLAPKELSGVNTSQVIKGFYNQYARMERYMDSIDKITFADLVTINGVHLPKKSEPEPESGTGESLPGIYGDLVPTIKLFTSSMAAVAADVRKAASTNGTFAQTMSENMTAYTFADTRKFHMQAARIDSDEERMAYIEAAGYSGNEATKIYDDLQPLIDLRRRKESVRKLQMLDKALQSGRITEGQYNNLSTMEGSYDDLSDSMNAVISKNEELVKVYQTIGNIPMYNFERLEQAFKGEVSGIKSAARGVVPSSIYNPLSRLADAGMNGLNAWLAPIKAGTNAVSSIGGGLVGTGAGMLTIGNPIGLGVMAAGGVLKAGSQIVGNTMEGRITQWGENIQNNLNTLGFIQDMILMPFKLLGSAVKLATRGLTTFTSGLKLVSNLMSGGLTGLQSMGNPLTGLTGSGYGDYMGALSADAASLLSSGTINNLYNDFASQRMALYTTGKLDTNRLVAASMLGVFNEAYGYTANEEEAFGTMVDKLLESLSGKSAIEQKRIFSLANSINPNLGSVLQTMNTLGLSSYSELQKPRNMWGYSQGQYDSYRSGWQSAQWEYQYAGTQWDTTKRRLATSLWNNGGRTLYNSFNATMSAVASGDWDTVGAKIKEIWTTLKEGADNVWNAISKTFGLGGKSFTAVLWEGIAKGLTVFRDTILPAINNIWDTILDTMIEKFANFISYLSTIKIDFKELVKAVQGKEHGDILTYLGDTRVGEGAYTGEFTYGKDGQDFASLLTLEKVASNYDRAMGKAPGTRNAYTGANYYGVAKHAKKVAGGYEQYYSNYEDYVQWIKDTVNGSSKSDLSILNNMLAEAGLVGNLTPENVDGYIDFLMQHDVNAAGAAFLHGDWATLEDTRNSDVYKGLRGFRGIEAKGRGIIETSLLNPVIEYANNKAILAITINDKGVAEMSVSADGTVAITDSSNSLVDVISRNGSGRFVIESMTQVQR